MASRLGLALGAGCLLAAVAFLAPPPPPVTHFGNRIPVRFWHMWSGEWQPIIEAAARRFNESQSKYEVIPLAIPPEGADSKFLLAVSGGDPPDLVSQWNPVLGLWVKRDLLTPIEDEMTPEERADYMANAFPIFRKHGIEHGKIYAMIAGVDVNAVYYRLDHLREVGLDAKHLPKTLEELVALGEKLDRRDDRGQLKRIGFLPQGFEAYAPLFGGTFGGHEKLTMDTPANRKAMEFVYGQVKRLGFGEVTRFLSAQAGDAGVNAPLIAGNYSILLDGQWRVKQTAQFAPKLEYAVAPLPPPAGGVPLASATAPNLMMIPKGAKHAKGAWEFLKFFIGVSNPETGGKVMSDMGWLPYSKRVAASKNYQDYLRKYPQFATFVEMIASPNLEIPPQGPIQAFVIDQITHANESLSRGTLSPAQAMDRLSAEVAKEISRQRRLKLLD